MTIYIVVEQYPHREVASFKTLEDAQEFMLSSRNLALPIIVTREVN
jgi:hypothetical protein